MRRREFISLLGGAAASWPLCARAQQPDRMRRIGALLAYAESDSEAQANVAAFREGLQKLGWTEGHNTRIDTRWPAPADAEAMQRFAKELVALQPDLILSHTTPTTTALLQQTRTIPYGQKIETVEKRGVVSAGVALPGGLGYVFWGGPIANRLAWRTDELGAHPGLRHGDGGPGAAGSE
jgi:hypothetical protein